MSDFNFQWKYLVKHALGLEKLWLYIMFREVLISMLCLIVRTWLLYMSPGGHSWGFYAGTLLSLLSHCNSMEDQCPVSLKLMTSQFKDIVTHTQKQKTVKCIFCSVWVENFVWNFKGALWNFIQNFQPILCKICILRGVKKLTTYDILESWHLKSLWDEPRVPNLPMSCSDMILR